MQTRIDCSYDRNGCVQLHQGVGIEWWLSRRELPCLHGQQTFFFAMVRAETEMGYKQHSVLIKRGDITE